MVANGWWTEPDRVRYAQDSDVRDAIAAQRRQEVSAWKRLEERWNLLSSDEVVGRRLGQFPLDLAGDFTIVRPSALATPDVDPWLIEIWNSAPASRRSEVSMKPFQVHTPLYPDARFPGFQFGKEGELRLDVLVVRALAPEEWSREILVIWLDAPNAWLDARPAELLSSQPALVLGAMARIAGDTA